MMCILVYVLLNVGETFLPPVFGMSLLYRDYINNVHVIFKGNLQRQSQKTYKPTTTVNLLAGSSKQTNIAVSTFKQKHTDLRAHKFAHCPDL